jgi:hypothetical protein
MTLSPPKDTKNSSYLSIDRHPSSVISRVLTADLKVRLAAGIQQDWLVEGSTAFSNDPSNLRPAIINPPNDSDNGELKHLSICWSIVKLL